VRVIAGTAKGLSLISPEGYDTRPTADRAREGLFNILSPLLPNASFLDIFSGSGAIGVEALSRGAARAVFVDSSGKAASVIESNIKKTGFERLSEVLCMKSDDAIVRLGNISVKFDIIFMDPPYGSNLADKALSLIADNNLLKPQGVAVVEMERRDMPPSCFGLCVVRQKSYGIAKFIFYKSELSA